MASLVTSSASVSSGDEGTGLSLFSFADYTDQGETNNKESDLLTLSTPGHSTYSKCEKLGPAPRFFGACVAPTACLAAVLKQLTVIHHTFLTPPTFLLSVVSCWPIAVCGRRELMTSPSAWSLSGLGLCIFRSQGQPFLP